MKHNRAQAVFRWVALFLALTGSSMLTRVPVSQAASAIPVAIVTCSTCESADALLGTALTYWAGYDGATWG